jgi:hypothetical protein
MLKTENNRGAVPCLGGTVEEGNAEVAGATVEGDNRNVSLWSGNTSEESNPNVTRCSRVNTRIDMQKKQKVDHVANDQGRGLVWHVHILTMNHDCEVCGSEPTCDDLNIISKGLQ